MILMSKPRAPLIEMSSSKGLDIAFCVASTALFSPEAIPIPIKAIPISDMMVFTSAKSRLIKPGMVIRSDMDFEAWSKTSSAFLKLSIKDIPLSLMLSSR